MVVNAAIGVANTRSRKCKKASVATIMMRLVTSVAHAAPTISRRGTPNQPKTNTGQSTALSSDEIDTTLPSSNELPLARIEARQTHISAYAG